MKDSQQLSDLKLALTDAVAAKDVPLVLSLSRTLMRKSPTLGTAAQVLRAVPLDLPHRAGIVVKVAILRSFTIEPVVPLLRALAKLYGIDLIVKVGEFNSYVQEIVNPSSWLYDFNPNIVILAAQTRDVAPDVWQKGADLSVADADSAVQSILAPIASLIGPLRTKCNASLIIHSFEQPLIESAGLFDSRREVGQAELVRMLNRQLNKEALRHDGVYVLDYDRLVTYHGRSLWHDETKWMTSRAPIASECLIHLAEEYLRFILPLSGRGSKVLAVDLDNTLWGGVVGEDGVHGIKIGDEYPGAAYLEVQRAILDLYNRGILLAICSKNNLADAMEALEHRKDMLLRPKHFAALRINWTDKAQNLKEIAAELNVGIDSLAFIDDNPVERDRVKQEIPEITVIDLPDDPMGYAMALRSSPAFERLSLTTEDRDRGRYYAEQRERQRLETSAESLEDFYRSLEMRAEFVDVSPETLERIAQLTQKTNQLNMTTRRYSEAEVQSLADHPEWRLFGIKISDKFGDNGLVGVVFVKLEDDAALIDTFLLSCRVIGRTVETAMLARVFALAAQSGCSKITGLFIPTRKNAPASKIYADHGFVATAETEDGVLWELDLLNDSIVQPEWIQ